MDQTITYISDYWELFIGYKFAKISRKPFKSGEKVNTVKSVIEHPITKRKAFIFEEDDSYVECHRCYMIDEQYPNDSLTVQLDTYNNIKEACFKCAFFDWSLPQEDQYRCHTNMCPANILDRETIDKLISYRKLV